MLHTELFLDQTVKNNTFISRPLTQNVFKILAQNTHKNQIFPLKTNFPFFSPILIISNFLPTENGQQRIKNLALA